MEHFRNLLDSFGVLYAVHFRKGPVERGGSFTKIMKRQLDKCWVLIHSVLQLFCFNGTPLETLALASSKDVNLPRNTKCFRFTLVSHQWLCKIIQKSNSRNPTPAFCFPASTWSEGIRLWRSSFPYSLLQIASAQLKRAHSTHPRHSGSTQQKVFHSHTKDAFFLIIVRRRITMHLMYLPLPERACGMEYNRLSRR